MAVGSTARTQARAAVDSLDVLQFIDVENLSRNEADYLLRVAAIAMHRSMAFFGSVALRAKEVGAHESDHFLSGEVYAAHVAGIEVGEAHRMIEVVEALRALPELDAEFRMGALSFAQVAAVVDGAKASPEDAERLLQVAHDETVKQLKAEVRRVQQRVEDPSEAPKKTYLRTRPDGPFHGLLNARLTNDELAKVLAAVDERAEAHFRAMWKDNTFVSYENCRARGLVDLATGGVTTPRTTPKPRTFDLSAIGKGPYVPAAVRRELVRKKVRCSHWGCDNSMWLQLDHNIERRDGGVSVLENLNWLCPAHHRIKTRRRMRLVGPRGQMRMRPLRPDEMGGRGQPP